MLRPFRARAGCLLTSLVLAIGTTAASLDQFLHTREPHDANCVAIDAKHDASRHRIRAAQSTSEEGAGHCVACHLARAPRLGVQAVAVAGRGHETVAPPPIQSIGFPSSATLARVPGRSPPRLV